jgi:acyl-CoA thioesterase-2
VSAPDEAVAEMAGGDALASLIELEPAGVDAFAAVAAYTPGRPSLFGGTMVAQALWAASRTVPDDRFPAFLHAAFLRAVRFGPELRYEVQRDQDGGSFSTRTVTATQEGERVFLMTATFHRDEDGGRAQLDPVRSPRPTGAEELPDRHREWTTGLDLLQENIPADGAGTAESVLWARTQGPMPADRVLSACVVAYVSDLRAGVVAPVDGEARFVPHVPHGSRITSLDHSLWFHHPVTTDGWLLTRVVPLSIGGARCLLSGTIHDEAGVHVATLSQAMLVRGVGS